MLKNQIFTELLQNRSQPLSGQMLANRYQVSRNAIWKTINALKAEGYPIDAVFGKKIKAPETFEDVRGLVIADYQEEQEKKWIERLRKKYPVVIYDDVLKTVNKH